MFIALACGAEPASESQPTVPPAPEVQPTPTVFERLLAFVPDTPDSRRIVRMNDIRGAADAQGIVIPGPDAVAEEVTQFKLDVAFGRERPATFITRLGGGWISGFNRSYVDQASRTTESLGFDARDIEAFALLGEANLPPLPFTEVLTGQFDAKEAPDLLTACEECPPHSVATYDSQDYFTWGGGEFQSLRNSQKPPSFDEFGRAGNIVVADEYVFRAVRVADLEALIDTESGAASNLLGDVQYRAIAQALGRSGAVSAVITDQPFDAETVIKAQGGEESFESMESRDILPVGTVDRIRDGIAASGPLKPFDLMAVGLGKDDIGAFALVILAYDDEETAVEAAIQLEERIENGSYPDLSGDGSNQSFLDRVLEFDIYGRDAMVIAQIRTPSPDELRDFNLFSIYPDEVTGYLYNRFVYLIATE